MVGRHFVRGWSKTQNSIALSSAEAELTALVKTSTEAIGIMAMAKDLGKTLKTSVFADSSAAIAITKRRGNGKLRHINIGLLWVQEKELRGEIEFVKVKGEMNPADLCTKYLSRDKAHVLCSLLGQYVVVGRAETSLRVQH